MNLPLARRGGLLTTRLEDEVVVYDPERKQAHSLNQVAVAVWHHCNGTNTIPELQRLVSDEIGTPLDEVGLWLALRKLERAHLLAENLGPQGVTRRHVLGKAGQLVGASLALPIVVSAFVPTAAAAASPVGEPVEPKEPEPGEPKEPEPGEPREPEPEEPREPEPEEPREPAPGEPAEPGDSGDSRSAGSYRNFR